MHDETSLTIGRVNRVLGERIRPAIHSARIPLDVAANHLPGEPIPPAAGLRLDYSPFADDRRWGPAWGTTWFRLRGDVPAEWAGKQVEALIDLGFDVNQTGFQCEGLAYRCGLDGAPVPVKGINPRNQAVAVADRATGGEQVELFVEAAANPVILDYHPFLPTRQGDVLTSSPEPLYRVRAMDLAVFEPEVFALALDVEVLLELQAELPETQPRRMRILQALDDALDVLDLQRIVETAPAARAALVQVLAAPADASAHRIAAIGHSHIDSAWLWPLRETIRKVARTTASMTTLLDEQPQYSYGMSSAQQYAWVKEHRPEVWERIRAAVADGRFLPLGGMWVEADTVMPTGESLARQFSYGQRFFEREFGIRSRGVWLPDSFGYSPALPQLMRRAGFDWFFTQKISWNQRNVFPHHTFDWEGIDGTRVFTHFPPMDTYCSSLSGAEVARAARQFKESRVATRSIAPVGYGDGGGGTTREMIGKAERLANLEGSARVHWVHPDEFFDAAKAELPDPAVWVGELYLELHRGTLTSQHATKATHRRCEQALLEAELWAATAAVQQGLAYPYGDLDALWEQVLLHQFHDILPGTSIAWVHREAVAVLTDVLARARGLAADARRALAGDGGVDLVFRPVHTPVDAAGALGAAPAAPPSGAVTLTPRAGGYRLTNELISVTVSKNGTITSAIDLATGREAIPDGRPANLFQLHQDFPNAWDAWDIDRYYRNRVDDLTAATSITGDLTDGVAEVVVTRTFSESSLQQTITLAPGSRTVMLRNRIDWHETEKLLKLAFPLDVFARETAAETQFGFQRRATHVNTSWEAAKFETSMHRFVLAEEDGFGVAVVNDSVYGYDTARDDAQGAITTTVRVSLLRAPRFPDPDTDHGVHEITVGLVVGADPAIATTEGQRLNAPETVVRGAGPVAPLVTLDGEGIVISAIKLADDRSGDVIVRLYEALGRRARGSLSVGFSHGGIREVSLIEDEIDDPRVGGDLDLRPFEVRTLRISRR
ncbi:Glycoside hydrolase family 38 OS=Tsukamurella paurometabola (strain ATCC 8368 / DSM / CCUG 35730/ CIP 100753 / JCM 10117 / KCTC 9821 / NBRC 16120 / NCIMB 702349 / NCTC 13040) OX=521096 GN=Tpau_2136 PE=3 SV=1 [Tsukamurella paurometabola]|uniref:Glycoside hydrolase family 38 n=1 Tax=Tsukamurella paurometabola (strain ATCC 8368 / DSM 20162 / CCUG 35730 / CIP 100753 / JCM 10117 / KCTC 9821 / NBRC 16120 / NCIMB 702349 / NCTC 13040) TaxID=521096 RepID=D5UPJ1_TSUPD|nr:glycoside hydrolase family 38 C-terminal domain-containing protein [Tsukamurella paurometabola]ADG78747.1 glycoside hydrolase family 38 [Tsukamurella paurometabola DSM 20162]SUP33001.1 Mannosylglycerate hydrolase [Tsukamurella paurometabola]